MATTEQMEGLLHQNAEFLMRMQQQQSEHMKELVTAMLKQKQEPQVGGGARGCEERKYREIGVYAGNEDGWKEFALKFKAVTREASGTIFEAMRWV